MDEGLAECWSKLLPDNQSFFIDRCRWHQSHENYDNRTLRISNVAHKDEDLLIEKNCGGVRREVEMNCLKYSNQLLL
jgi:hypothetical protein